MKISLNNALLALVAVVLVVGLVPAGLLLDRRLVTALERDVRDDLSAAPLVLADRFSSLSSARMMHARDVSVAPGLADALAAGDSAAAVESATAVADAFPGEAPLVIDTAGRSWAGPPLPASLVDTTRSGVLPVLVVQAGDQLGTAALAPVTRDGRWLGAAGVWVPMDEGEAAQLAALTSRNRSPAKSSSRTSSDGGWFARAAKRPIAASPLPV